MFGFSLKDNVYVIRNAENKVIGFANVNINEDLAHIMELEILEEYRYCGYGREFVKELFKQYNLNELTGNAMYSAVDFWIGLGANIEIPCNNCYNAENNCCDYDDYEICDDYTGEFSILKEDLYV